MRDDHFPLELFSKQSLLKHQAVPKFQLLLNLGTSFKLCHFLLPWRRNKQSKQLLLQMAHKLLALPQIYIFHIYAGPKFTQITDLHGTQIYTNPDLHGTHIYTAQIYTNPFPHIDSKKPKFTQPKFTQNPNLHNPTLHITQIYTKLFLQI